MARSATGWMFGSDAEVQAELENRLERWRSCEPHEVLGVASETGEGEIRAAYLGLIKQLHPNRFARRGPDLKRLANEVFLTFKVAHQALCDIRAGKKPRRGPGRPGTMSQPIPHVSRLPSSMIAGNSTSPSRPIRPRPDIRQPTNPLPAPPPRAGQAQAARPRPRPQRKTLQGTVVPGTVASKGPGSVERPGDPTLHSPDGPRAGAGKNRPGRVARQETTTDAVPVVPPPGPAPSRLTPPASESKAGQAPPRSRVRFRPATPGPGPAAAASRSTGTVSPEVRDGKTPASSTPGSGDSPPPWTSDEVNRARDLLKRGAWSEAAQALQRLVAAMPGNRQLAARLHYARAREHREHGNLVDANIELRRALEADPGCDEARRELADLQGPTSGSSRTR